MATAISGAEIIRESMGACSMNHVLYSRHCDICRRLTPYPPISVRMVTGQQSGVYGTYHLERFVCPFCGNHQVVKLEG
jgi:hypothetical protein